MTSFEEKSKSYADYLRSRQLKTGVVATEIINSLSDEDILESYRLNAIDQTPFYTKEQERQVIMEYESNEAIFDALDNIINTDNSEKQEKEIVKEFEGEIQDITIAENPKIKNLLDRFKEQDICIEIEDIDEAIQEIVSIFPEWIMDGYEYAIKEIQPNKFSIITNKCCSTCLLDNSLHNYKTLLGWSNFTLNGEISENSNNPSVFSYEVQELLRNELADLFIDSGSFIEDVIKNPTKNPKSVILFGELTNLICRHIFGLSLISCWVRGKDRAQERINEMEENQEFLEQVKEQFKDYDKALSDKNVFFTNVENFLRALSFDQVLTIYSYGFPLNLSKKDDKKMKKLLENILDTKENEELQEIVKNHDKETV